ncbi:flagellar hook-basal body complex protein FliE [Defluviitalea phaphyphila]|uniref:flagellar hook-basal body complex protein FliE n=1 Tax=Defluviitalea phaphyphila TaxID=1473580 RepID=UPI0007311673|nr:flagellar hook-basal body complex protein FliE [Defluviitalea phaphyphila]
MEITKINPFNLSEYTNNSKQVKSNEATFEDFYKAALGLIDKTNQLQKEADQIGLDFMMGKTDNIHNVMIAQEKANIALQFTVQVQSKVLEAYQEIMRITL